MNTLFLVYEASELPVLHTRNDVGTRPVYFPFGDGPLYSQRIGIAQPPKAMQDVYLGHLECIQHTTVFRW